MPYGAPELLQSRRERLASALLLSSLAVAVLFLATGGFARLIVVPPVRVPSVILEPYIIVPPPVWSSPRPPAPIPHVRVPIVAGVPVPVPDLDAPLDRGAGTTADVGPVGPGPASGAGQDANAVTGEEHLPAPDEYVWVEVLPEPVTRITPPYPAIAQEAGVEGLVIVKALVGKTGRVLDVRLDEKRRVPLLNDAALAAARLWVFTPALSNGKPVPVWTAIPFNFRLH